MNDFVSKYYSLKAWSACSIIIIIRVQSGIEHEERFVSIQYAAKEANHLLFGRFLITWVIRSATLVPAVLRVRCLVPAFASGVDASTFDNKLLVSHWFQHVNSKGSILIVRVIFIILRARLLTFDFVSGYVGRHRVWLMLTQGRLCLTAWLLVPIFRSVSILSLVIFISRVILCSLFCWWWLDMNTHSRGTA